MNTLLLLLLDSRAPAGAHHHSGGMEAAVAAGRLQSDWAERATVPASSPPRAVPAESWAQENWAQENWAQENWALLDAEFEARTPSEATRAASRQLGGGLLRLLRSVLPDADLVTPWAQCAGPAPHHPLVLGAGVSLAGGPPELAARAAALSACAGPASAAVRLLGLDPFAVQAMLARLAPAIDECAALAARCAGAPSLLPADSAPALDLLADYHLTAEVR